MDELYHYGVKGMKWGVRKASKKTKKGRSKRNSIPNKIKKGYDATWDMLEGTVGRKNLRYARDGLAFASAMLWITAEAAPMMSLPVSGLAAVTNMASIIIDPDD